MIGLLQNERMVSEDEVILAHLWSEQKSALRQTFTSLNVKDTIQNGIRRTLLYLSRGGIYQGLFSTAGRIDWYCGIIEPAAFVKLKIIPSYDWIDIPGGTLPVSTTAKRFQTPNDPIFKTYSHHLAAVNRYEKNLEDFPITLILISADPIAEFTVIDGVHHAVAAYLRYFLRSPGSKFISVIAYLGYAKTTHTGTHRNSNISYQEQLL